MLMAADGRAQLHGPHRRVELDPVDDVVALQHGVMHGLAELVAQGAQCLLHPQLFGPGLVVGEGKAQQLIAQDVPAVPVLAGEPCPAQGGQGPVDSGLSAVDGAAHIVEAYPRGMAGQLGQDGQHPVGAHKAQLPWWPSD